MADTAQKPRIALLGAGLPELELLAELHRSGGVVWVGVYDPDPLAVGLGVAEVLGIPAGAGSAARERISSAEFVVLPQDRRKYRATVEWLSGSRSELVSLEEARRRWGGAGPWPERRKADSTPDAELRRMLDTSTQLQHRSELADWLLALAMRAVGASGGSIQLLAPETAELYLVAARGLSERIVRESRQALGTPISGIVAATRELQVLHGPQPTTRPQRGAITSAVSLPLEDGDSLVGVLNVSTSERGREYGRPQVETLQHLAPAIATLLQRAQRLEALDDAALDFDLPRLLRRLEAEALQAPALLAALCQQLAQAFEAEWVSMYVATEEGDWSQVGSSVPPAAGLPPVSRTEVGKAYLDQTWLHRREQAAPSEGEAADALVDAVERALAPAREVRSRVYAPLSGTAPLGVFVAEFERLGPAERFTQHAEPMLQQVALYVETKLRDRRQEVRQQRLGRLARLVPKLLAARGSESLDLELARQAAELVGARRALVRRVDERRHTYSRPVAYGLPDTELEAWRRIDAQVAERTLQSRRAVLTTAVESESERLDEGAAYRSLISVPLLHQEQLVGVLDVYDKQPQEMQDGFTFTSFDRELLESLASIAAPLYRDAASVAAVAESPDVIGATRAESEARAVEPPSSPKPVVEPSRARLMGEFEREIARAGRYHHGLSVSLLRMNGLPAAGASEQLREELESLVQKAVRSTDLSGWWGPSEIVVVSPELHTRNRELEERIQKLLQTRLEPLAAEGHRVDVQVGSSTYPRDGQDVPALLASASERVH